MKRQVKVACQGAPGDKHPTMTLATYEYGPATGWHRQERYADTADVRHLPTSSEMAPNTPGARFKEYCRVCDRTPERTWDELVALLESARVEDKRRITIL